MMSLSNEHAARDRDDVPHGAGSEVPATVPASPPHTGGRARFSGYPANARATVVPNLFFSAVLPTITDSAELVVSVYLFFAAGRKRAFPRFVTFDELVAEPPLRQALSRLGLPSHGMPAGGVAPSPTVGATRAPGTAAEDAVRTLLRRALDAAVARGTVLRVEREGRELYLVHTEAARESLRSSRFGRLVLPPVPEPLPDEPPPSIYVLYEENIGTISPLIADELREAESSYPSGWIIAAFREAVAMNKRNWRYVSRILERWRAEGRGMGAPGREMPGGARARDLEGRYRGVVRR